MCTAVHVHNFTNRHVWVHLISRAFRHSPSVLADQQETEQSYQDPLTLSIADDDNDVQPEYDYINAENDQQPMIELTQCPAYRSTAQR